MEGKVLATCPFEYAHASGKDENPSFVVFGSDTGDSFFNCSYPHSEDEHCSGSLAGMVTQYCKDYGIPTASAKWGDWNSRKVSLEGLLKYVWKNEASSGKNISLADRFDAAVYAPSRKFTASRKHIDPKDALRKAIENIGTLPDKYLDQFEELEGDSFDYLRGPSRSINRETQDMWELLYDPGWKRLVIPVRDMRDRLVAVSRRSIYDWQKPKYLHGKGFKRRFFLFGEAPRYRKGVKESNKNRGIIVEGQFDVIRLWQYGYRNAVAIFGADMTDEQIEKFASMFSEAIILGDGDAAGQEASKKIAKQLEDRAIKAEIRRMPPGKDPGDPLFTKREAREVIGEPDVGDKLPF